MDGRGVGVRRRNDLRIDSGEQLGGATTRCFDGKLRACQKTSFTITRIPQPHTIQRSLGFHENSPVDLRIIPPLLLQV